MERRKFVIGLGALASGAAAATGTGAFSSMTAERDATLSVVDDSSALVALEVGGGRGVGEIVGMNNGDLEIDFTSGQGGQGVNDNSKYQLGAMNDDALGDGLESTDFESIYDDDTVGYRAAGDGRPYVAGDDIDQSAFVVKNQTDSTIDLEIGYVLDEDSATQDEAGATLYLQGAASDINDSSSDDSPSKVDSATATSAIDLADPTVKQTQPLEALSFNDGNPGDSGSGSPGQGESIPSGEAVYVSLQIDTTDSPDTTGEQVLDGSLVINANAAAEQGVE
ncbi:hypothetical protein [Halorubrum sp. PV6]|uniref:hypothetical protein n=1 Tax=Halorubrum sp. PV6 TaxID=634157 RepID=UPI000F8EE678|nr:hypothetical protein [Halorubrum sp. PV6]